MAQGPRMDSRPRVCTWFPRAIHRLAHSKGHFGTFGSGCLFWGAKMAPTTPSNPPMGTVGPYLPGHRKLNRASLGGSRVDPELSARLLAERVPP